jgi:membrane protein implicated in regulation of membrane protease activity
MKLIDDIKDAPKFWSVRLAIVSAAFSALEVSLPMFRTEVEPGTFAILSALVAVLAAVARTIKQESLS